MHAPRAGTYTLSIPGAGEDDNATGDLDILSDITIKGVSAGQTILDGNQLDRLIDVGSGVTGHLIRLTIRHGQTSTGGGGLLNLGSLTISECDLNNNTSSVGGGGIFNDGDGELTINDSIIRQNTAGYYGGGIWNNVGRTAVINNSTISANHTLDAGSGSNGSNGNPGSNGVTGAEGVVGTYGDNGPNGIDATMFWTWCIPATPGEDGIGVRL
jgi:hypothetical protein